MQRQFIQIDGTNLQSKTYVNLVGCFSHVSSVAIHHHPVDQRHLYLWVSQPDTGFVYECAVHTRLTYESRIQSCWFTEPLETEKWPNFGVYTEDQSLSYRSLGLTTNSFFPVGRRSLSDELSAFAARSDRIQVYGFANAQGNGVHDIHQNSGEPPHRTRSDRPSKDGALVFYYGDRPGIPAHKLWLCLKFEEQSC
jgi:hypothetical protein